MRTRQSLEEIYQEKQDSIKKSIESRNTSHKNLMLIKLQHEQDYTKKFNPSQIKLHERLTQMHKEAELKD